MRRICIALVVLCGCAPSGRFERLEMRSAIIDTTSRIWACEVKNLTASRLQVCAELTRWDGARCIVGPRVIEAGSSRSFAGDIGAEAPHREWTGGIGAFVVDPSDEADHLPEPIPQPPERMMVRATSIL